MRNPMKTVLSHIEVTAQINLNTLVNKSANISHINGSLLEHLKGTYDLLESWGAHKDLCAAGLYHALYGTSGFENQLLNHNDRNQAKAILGERVEKIVYTYCACDRDFFWPQIGVNQNPIFLNRFNGERYLLTSEELGEFCELTVANELEIARNSDEFIKKYGLLLSELFDRMKPYISLRANKFKAEVFGVKLI